MKIRVKVIALIGGLFVALGAAQLFVQDTILLPSFAELERQDAQTDMDRVANTVARDLDLLEAMAADWGDWDETYQFMQDRNPRFIATSMTTSTIQGYRANAVAFVDLSGKFVWARAIAPGSGAPIDIDVIGRGALPADHLWQDALRTGTVVTGLLRTNRGAMLTAFAPVLDGTHHGPHRGMVLLGRLLTPTEIARIGEQAQVRLSARLVPALESAPALARPAVAPARTAPMIVRESVTEVYRDLTDVAHAPLLTLRIDVPRRISARGHAVVRYASLFLMGAGAAALVLLVLLLNRSVLNPLARMTRHAVRIGQSDDLTSRLDLQRTDELGALGHAFDQMVGRVAEARRQLVDHSYEAGIAENASGVLHNLGNAMTPLCVKVASLQNALRQAPTADIDLVLTELEQTTAASGRTADLEAFLRLTSRELAGSVTTLQGDVDAIAGTTQTIQALLADQTRHARAPPALETLDLPDLVQQSTALVSPKLLQRLSIEIDDSLRELGSVRLARTTLQQVFQNLIVNAAEAVSAAGHGTLRIAGHRVPLPDGDTLDLSFTDDGLGITPEHVGRVFEKGFSTKPSATNLGIGLHWCANAVHALEGTLRAESPGPNRGATFHLLLPLERPANLHITQAA